MTKPVVCCKVCGSINVQYAIWHNPNTGEVGECFGSWNAGDNTFCADCDAEDRNANPDLIHATDDAKLFAKLRAERLKFEDENPDG